MFYFSFLFPLFFSCSFELSNPFLLRNLLNALENVDKVKSLNFISIFLSLNFTQTADRRTKVENKPRPPFFCFLFVNLRQIYLIAARSNLTQTAVNLNRRYGKIYAVNVFKVSLYLFSTSH